MISMGMRRSIVVHLLLGILLAGCAAPSPMLKGGEHWVADRLYFGRAIAGEENVSEEAWREFLREIVTPRFPEGLTVWSAEGQWRDSLGTIIREATFVLELMHPPHVETDESIETIIEEYKRRFRQESVMWARENVSVRF